LPEEISNLTLGQIRGYVKYWAKKNSNKEEDNDVAMFNIKSGIGTIKKKK
jgi:hypothetical protein